MPVATRPLYSIEDFPSASASTSDTPPSAEETTSAASPKRCRQQLRNSSWPRPAARQPALGCGVCSTISWHPPSRRFWWRMRRRGSENSMRLPALRSGTGRRRHNHAATPRGYSLDGSEHGAFPDRPRGSSGRHPSDTLFVERRRALTTANMRRVLLTRDILEKAATRFTTRAGLSGWLHTPRGASSTTPAEYLKRGDFDRARLLAVSSPSSHVRPPLWVRDVIPEENRVNEERRQVPEPLERSDDLG